MFNQNEPVRFNHDEVSDVGLCGSLERMSPRISSGKLVFSDDYLVSMRCELSSSPWASFASMFSLLYVLLANRGNMNKEFLRLHKETASIEMQAIDYSDSSFMNCKPKIDCIYGLG